MLNFQGGNFVSYVLQIRLLKTDRFYWFYPKRSAETPLDLGLTDVFFKKSQYDCTSVLNDEIPEEKVHLMSKMSVLQQFSQKLAQVGQKWHFFVF